MRQGAGQGLVGEPCPCWSVEEVGGERVIMPGRIVSLFRMGAARETETFQKPEHQMGSRLRYGGQEDRAVLPVPVGLQAEQRHIAAIQILVEHALQKAGLVMQDDDDPAGGGRFRPAQDRAVPLLSIAERGSAGGITIGRHAPDLSTAPRPQTGKQFRRTCSPDRAHQHVIGRTIDGAVQPTKNVRHIIAEVNASVGKGSALHNAPYQLFP
ncbi:Zinc carboxypeptidase [Corchorus olitorius]|uniref:Zinc carboxypeptidase n=1 Tax=Corchorus olitorius TaxID=93759 RepID=A0A1R3L1Y2_9ROSI|nr:Zinc carboxypeptidase [Corchorus olitorius]